MGQALHPIPQFISDLTDALKTHTFRVVQLPVDVAFSGVDGTDIADEMALSADVRKFLLILRRWDRVPGSPPGVIRTFEIPHEFVLDKSHIPSLQCAEDCKETESNGRCCDDRVNPSWIDQERFTYIAC